MSDGTQSVIKNSPEFKLIPFVTRLRIPCVHRKLCCICVHFSTKERCNTAIDTRTFSRDSTRGSASSANVALSLRLIPPTVLLAPPRRPVPMDDRLRRPDPAMDIMQPSSHPRTWRGATRSRSRTTSPASAQRRFQHSDEMRIQVHDDGVVEFSVMLGSNIDASQLAQLVTAVRSSTSNPRPSNGPASSPDLSSLMRAIQPTNAADKPISFERPQAPRRFTTGSASFSHAVPRAHPQPRPHTPPLARSASFSPNFPTSPRLPDRAKPCASRSETTFHLDRGSYEPNEYSTHSRRSVSTPDLRQTGAIRNSSDPIIAVDASGDALMADVRVLSFDLPDINNVDMSSDNLRSNAIRGLPAPAMRTRTTNPPGKMQQVIDDELSSTWQGVEYELTEKYRLSDAAADAPKISAIPGATGATHSCDSISPDAPLPSPPPRAPWRLLARMRRRRRAITNLGTAPDAKMHRAFGSTGTFTRAREDANQSFSLSFTTIMSREQAVGELSRFAKLRGNQVWRRPGEHKLRCVRKLSRSCEMHMTIVVESKMNETVVSIRRSKSDRSRTELWRYTHFYGDVMDRLSATGHHVVPLTSVPANGLSFRPRS